MAGNSDGPGRGRAEFVAAQGRVFGKSHWCLGVHSHDGRQRGFACRGRSGPGDRSGH